MGKKRKHDGGQQSSDGNSMSTSRETSDQAATTEAVPQHTFPMVIAECDELLLWNLSERMNRSQAHQLGVKLGMSLTKLENLNDKVQSGICSQEEMNFEMLHTWKANQIPGGDLEAKLRQTLKDLEFPEKIIQEIFTNENHLHQSTQERELKPLQLYQIAEKVDKSQHIPIVLRLGLEFNDLKLTKQRCFNRADYYCLFTLLLEWQRNLPPRIDQIKTVSSVLSASQQKRLAYSVISFAGNSCWNVIRGDRGRSVMLGTETCQTSDKFCDKDLIINLHNPAKQEQMLSKVMSMFERCNNKLELSSHGETDPLDKSTERVKKVHDECQDVSRLLNGLQEAGTRDNMYEMNAVTFGSINPILHVRVYSEEGLKILKEDIDSGAIGRRLAGMLMSHETGASSSDDEILNITLATGTIDQISQKSAADLQNDASLRGVERQRQEFSTPVKHKINIEPHYSTIVMSRKYDYYMSEGSDPLPYALAELIDNSLSATVNNVGPRKIEVRLYLEGNSPKNWMVCVLDNGKGMTVQELGDWALLRRSKFDVKRHLQYSRKPLGEQHERRFLNSDISFFGVGGRQACFFMGESVTVFSKDASFVHLSEMTMAKQNFEEREKSGKRIFHEDLIQRLPGDACLHGDNQNLVDLIAEEKGKDSFTHVVITGIRPENFKRVRKNMHRLCTELANVYHYYIHGLTDNIAVERETTSPSMNETDGSPIMAGHHPVEISVTRYRDGMERTCTKLHEIQDDFQSQFIRTAADTFEFQITVPTKLDDDEPNQLIKEERKIEGVLRYHPFRYTKETYPAIMEEYDEEEDPDSPEEEEEEATRIGDPSKPARGNQPIFSCYWNGRLVPYTRIKEFPWCSRRKTERTIPVECYNRLSGVLFTNDFFSVSTNKLTFLDLEEKLAEPGVMFDMFDLKSEQGQYKSATIEKHFKEWLAKCHRELDKQILFKEPTEIIERNKKRWTRFMAIEWDGHTFCNGQLVRRRNKTTVNHGRIQSFLLEGENREELYSSGGMFEIKLEPVAVYQGEIGLHHLPELDRTATEEDIIRSLGLEEGKLPKHLIHRWVDGHNMQPADNGKWTLQSGKEMGGFQAIIRTSDGIEISRMPSKGKAGKPLAVTAQLIKKTNTEEKCIVSIDNPNHIKDYGYVFKNLAVTHFPLGEYILRLAVTMKSQNASAEYSLPRTDIEFTVIDGSATRFDIGVMPSSLQIRKPFSVKLNLTDYKNNPALPPQNMQPNLTCILGRDRMLEVKSGPFAIEGNSLVSHDVTVIGNMGHSKSARSVKAKLVVAMPQLINQKRPRAQEISVEPGMPNKLRVPALERELCHENGKALKIEVLIEDADGNLTSGENMNIACKFGGDKDVPTTYHGTAAPNGKVTLTGDRITMHNLKGPKEIKATVYSQDHNVDRVSGTIKIEPRKGPAMIQVFDEEGNEIGNEEVITRTAGNHIDNFGFKLLDEAGRDIKVTQRIACAIYFGGKSYPQLFMSGKLPPIQIEKKVDKQPTHYGLHLRKEEVEFNFSIRSTPGPAASVRVLTAETGHFTLLCGDALNVPVEITDAYGNSVDAKEPPPKEEFFLEAEDGKPLRYEQLIQEGECFIFSDLQYPKTATVTFRGTVRYKGSKAAFTVNIIPGPPAQLMLMNDDEKISTFRGVALGRDVIYRLLDQYGNVVCEPKYHVAIKCSTDDVKILGDSPVCRKHDSLTGDYIFIGLAVDGPWGVHHIIGEVQMDDRHLQSPPIKIEVLPNPDRPHQIMVDFRKQEKYEAGEDFPSCVVTVFAENGKVMTTLQREDVTVEMKSWNGDVVKRLADEARGGKYKFSSITVPTTVGKYSLTCFVRLPDGMASSDEVFFDVVPGPPFQLMPMKDLPGEPQVSNTNDSRKRTIMMANTFCLMDKHNNCVDADIPGTVQVEITAASGQETVPLLEGETVHQLLNSRVDIPDVCIKKGCCGVNATVYILSVTPVLPDHDVMPYERSFWFYNGVEEHEGNIRLTLEKSILQEKMKEFEENYEKLGADMKELQGMIKQAHVEGRHPLLSAGPESVILQTSTETEQKRREGMEAVERISHLPRQSCRIPVYPKQDKDILGKVAHLAQVEDEREAKVLSWHLSSAMDCVVTTTMQKAEEIRSETNGQQGLLVLNRPFSSTDWEKPLPHEHRRFLSRGDSVPCNVVYAKHQLKFNVHVEKCKQVFHQLLGDIIIVDCMEDAVKYQKMVLRSMDCPTILTRDGGRLSEDGIFSGSLNQCPADLSGRVFNQPEHSELHSMRRQIGSNKRRRQQSPEPRASSSKARRPRSPTTA